MSSSRWPVVYLPHGGGPWPFVDLPVFERDEVSGLLEFLSSLLHKMSRVPASVLVISAHWEERIPTVMSAPNPPMLYDYHGFPPEAYRITWPAPGDPALAARVRALLGAAGFATAEDPQRGFDHGTFVPLKLMIPDANVPTVQLSILRSLDPPQHIAMGRALAPLRDEDVLILGSGMSYHDVPRFFDRSGRAASETFDAWLCAAATTGPEERVRLLQAWTSAPDARRAHPREDHLLPLMVVAGAAGSDPGRIAYNGLFGNARVSAFQYG